MTGVPAGITLERDGIAVSGPDAEAFLQGQLSQDIATLGEGASAWSLLLEPTGKTVAWLRVTRTAAETFLLDLDAGHGGTVIDRLNRFLIRTKCTIEPVALVMLSVRGAGASAISADTVVRHDPGWPSVDGVDLVGPQIDPPEGLAVLSETEFSRMRIRAGVPAMGREITADVIPAELGVIDRSVAFDKGCYTGQELVARIDSRGGNVPRHLRIIEVADREPPVGAGIWFGEDESGSLTSVVAVEGGAVALGLVHRRVTSDDEVIVRWEADEASGRVRAVPVVG